MNCVWRKKCLKIKNKKIYISTSSRWSEWKAFLHIYCFVLEWNKYINSDIDNPRIACLDNNKVTHRFWSEIEETYIKRSNILFPSNIRRYKSDYSIHPHDNICVFCKYKLNHIFSAAKWLKCHSPPAPVQMVQQRDDARRTDRTSCCCMFGASLESERRDRSNTMTCFCQCDYILAGGLILIYQHTPTGKKEWPLPPRASPLNKALHTDKSSRERETGGGGPTSMGSWCAGAKSPKHYAAVVVRGKRFVVIWLVTVMEMQLTSPQVT